MRLEEKETMLNKKTKQIQDMAEEKGTQAGEIHDLKDMLDVKERKVNVLQKKVRHSCCERGGPPVTAPYSEHAAILCLLRFCGVLGTVVAGGRLIELLCMFSL